MDRLVMNAPEGMTSVSYDGVAYEVFEGTVCVPVEAGAELEAHGLTVAANVHATLEEKIQSELDACNVEIETVETELLELTEKRDKLDASLKAAQEAEAANHTAEAKPAKGKGK